MDGGRCGVCGGGGERVWGMKDWEGGRQGGGGEEGGGNERGVGVEVGLRLLLLFHARIELATTVNMATPFGISHCIHLQFACLYVLAHNLKVI